MVSGISEAHPSGLGKLLMESRFAVPNHQRDYSWTEQVKQLFDDIDAAIDAPDETYFLGLMVFMASATGELIFFSSRRRHTSFDCDWSSDVCSSDLQLSIKLDLEVDYLPGQEDWIRELAARHPWDYFIGSVHYVSDSWAIDDPSAISKWKGDRKSVV